MYSGSDFTVFIILLCLVYFSFFQLVFVLPSGVLKMIIMPRISALH